MSVEYRIALYDLVELAFAFLDVLTINQNVVVGQLVSNALVGHGEGHETINLCLYAFGPTIRRSESIVFPI